MSSRPDSDAPDALARVSVYPRSPVSGCIAGFLVWSAFAAVVVTQCSLTRFERNVVLLASGPAVLAAGTAVWLYRSDRPVAVLFLASPFVVTAVSLPPVVTALLVGQYPEIPVSRLPSVVATVEWTLLDPVGLQRPFANTFDREGVGYTVSWLLYSVPVGWLLGATILQFRFLSGEDL